MTDDGLYARVAPRFAEARDKPFLTAPDGRSRTYGEIAGIALKMAGALAAAGAQPGDRIAAQVEKSAENVALYLASLLGGFVYLPLNTAYTDDELSYFIADAEPSVFVTDPARADAAPKGPRIMTLDAAGRGALAAAASNSAPLASVVRGRDDLAVILYTSGTTGRPKGAMITHGNLTSNAEALNSIWGFGGSDRLLHALPIFHIHGLFVALNTAMLSGAEVLFLPKFDAGEVRRLLPRARVMMGVPTFYTRLLADPEFSAAECRNIRLFISGSAPLTPETFRAFEARTGHRILERYGMSEAGMIASNPLNGERIAGTVGYPVPGVALRIGEGGVVEVKGPNIFKGYWRNPEKTAEEFREGGWFSTGDIGALSVDGRLTLSGRAKDLIIVGGYNVYPKEVEEILDSLPEIAESAVIGVPHPDMGEGVVAALVPARGSAAAPPLSDAQLKDAVSVLARFKQPRTFFWIDALPRNAMGKVQKAALREGLKPRFNARSSE
ncbi:MAG TPA: malonyl-CoA synthase [Parvularcula sp.]|nr:malonyl-CoA synthase [Parvularcula sp.]HBS31910.1 malonyl-CoA synthase [Parvularcula sp.]HBS34097.1 malonyl-CoA synthase [Parvularcula sp.]